MICCLEEVVWGLMEGNQLVFIYNTFLLFIYLFIYLSINSYDPSSTFKGFDSDRDYKAMAEGKTVKGIYAKREEGNNPHLQRVMWGRRKKKVIKHHTKHN